MAAQRRCGTCGSPLDGDQRYCLTCGARSGERSPQLRELLGNLAPGAGGGTAAASAASAVPTEAAERGRPLRLPGPRISAVLVAVFVGFGALIGNAAAGSGTATPARAVRLLAGPSTGTATTPADATSSSGGAASESPESEPEATPAAAESEEEAEGGETPAAPSSGGEEESAPRENTPAGAHKGSASAHQLTDVKHVFVVVLDDEPYAELFGPESQGHYLASTLEHKGELLVSYDAIAHEQLPNGIALLSGQGPTAQTAANCPAYIPVTPASAAADAQVLGDGCVYPGTVETLPGELAGKHLSWHGYLQGVAEAAGQPGPCPHPTGGAAEPATGSYASYRNPFAYFESLVQSPACQSSVVGLSALKADLATAAQTPSFSYIVPDRCHDAGPAACSPGAESGPAAASALLEEVVGEILSSPAYKRDGLLVITADEAPSSGEFADSSSCCGQPKYPNYTSPLFGQGGGQVGALLLSPFVKGGTTSSEPYDHFSLLRTIEDVFGVHHLGYSALPAVKPLSASLLNAPAGGH